MSDGVLVAGFGGPTPGCCGRRPDCPARPGVEAACFVASVLGDRPGSAARVEAVAAHYHHLGGYSPYHRHAAAQARALARELARRGWRELAVELGHRHWRPWLAEAAARLNRCRRVAGLILAPFALGPLAEGYRRAVPLPLRWADPWYAHPGHLEALADRVREAVLGWEAARWERAALLFTAHALPRALAEAAGYEAALRATAAAVAASLGRQAWRLAYQSAPEGAEDWTGPELAEALAQLAAAGHRDAVAVPLGFLSDHVEVLYDLDIAAQRHAAAFGLLLTRAGTPGEHPGLIAALADAAEAALAAAP